MSRQFRSTLPSAARSFRALLALAGLLATVLVALTPGTAQADDPPYGVDAISVGGFHTCALAGNAISCWGRNDNGQLDVPAGSYSQVSAGRTHTCALRVDQTIACWGDNAVGQADAPGGTFTEVSAGGRISCGLRTDGSGVCWGSNNWGALGVPDVELTQISAAAGFSPEHACGLRTDQTIVCWGGNVNGQASPPAGTFTQVSTGGHHTCAIRTNGTGVCWGYNALGQAPGNIGPDWASISSGGFHNCGLRSDSTVTCWGMNYMGESNPPDGTFTAVSVSDEWATAARGTSCGLRPDRTIICWGDGIYGQRGPGVENAPPAGQVGTPYTHGFATSPVVPALEFSLASGALPPGLTLAADGSISGTPTDAGTYEFRACGANGIAPTACANVAIEVTKIPTTTTITANDPAEFGDQVTLDAQVTADGPAPTGTVTFIDAGEPIPGCSNVPINAGTASCNTDTLAVGAHEIEATYSGDTTHQPSTGSHTVTVTKIATELVASRASWLLPTFRATLTRSSNGSPLAGQTITFRVGDRVMCTATTRDNGVASCSALALLIGPRSYSATYVGSATVDGAVAEGQLR